MAQVEDFTLVDQAGRDWSLAEHRDAAVVLAFYRGDW
jgi:peroxiredoxin